MEIYRAVSFRFGLQLDVMTEKPLRALWVKTTYPISQQLFFCSFLFIYLFLYNLITNFNLNT